MIIYLCMKYESNTPMFSKDIARKPFFVRTGQDVRDVRMYVHTDKGDAICPPHIKWRGHKKIILLFLSYCPLQIWALETCNQDISKIIIASSFKHGQLVEDDESITS